MKIKKHKNKNQYLYSNHVYIRDFTSEVKGIDLNIDKDYDAYVENEFENLTKKYPFIDKENFKHEKVLIVSDGYDFDKKAEFLYNLPNNITIICVNRSLSKWSSGSRVPNYYLVNNPYKECLNYLPNKSVYPKCISSIRTNKDFLNSYHGIKYLYIPTHNEFYSGVKLAPNYFIDDYKNPVCAAISIAYRFQARKILLYCCDDSFDQERPGAENLGNNLWRYPQHGLSQNIIDGMAFWLKNKKIEIADHSNNGIYNNIPYINSSEDLMRYLNE